MEQLFKDRVIVNILDNLKILRRKNQFTSKITPRLSFICGEQILDSSGNKLPENIIKNHIRFKVINMLERCKTVIDGKELNKVLCVISEFLYNKGNENDILTFEELLADLSDDIIIIVESPGTFCELGAFSLDDRYADKLVIINEDKAEYKDSFISKGPIKKILKSNEDNVILHNGKQWIDSSLQFNETIKKLGISPVKIVPNKVSKELDPKMLIYELLNLIELFQPINMFEINYIYKYINGFENYDIKNRNKNKLTSINMLLDLMIDLNVIYKENGFCYIKDNISSFDAMFTLDRKDFNDIRNDYINRLIKIEPFRIGGGVSELSG